MARELGRREIEAGRMELEVTTFDLAQAIDDGVTLMRERGGPPGSSSMPTWPSEYTGFEGTNERSNQ